MKRNIAMTSAPRVSRWRHCIHRRAKIVAAVTTSDNSQLRYRLAWDEAPRCHGFGPRIERSWHGIHCCALIIAPCHRSTSTSLPTVAASGSSPSAVKRLASSRASSGNPLKGGLSLSRADSFLQGPRILGGEITPCIRIYCQATASRERLRPNKPKRPGQPGYIDQG
jgi:hypothetical protein